MNPDISSCAVFNFALNVSYVPISQDEDLFNCDAQPVPANLNAPGFISPLGFGHFADWYSIHLFVFGFMLCY